MHKIRKGVSYLIFAMTIILSCIKFKQFISYDSDIQYHQISPYENMKPVQGVTEDVSIESTYLHGVRDNGNIQYLDYIRNNWIDFSNVGMKKKMNLTIQGDGYDYSQMSQSLFVKDLLKGKRSGFFVESGAGDGEFLSNTLYLERELQWTGLLIEPNPDLYQKLRTKQRNCYITNSCLNTKPYSQKHQFQNRQTWSKIHKDDNFTKSGHNISLITVQCFPLVALIAAIGIQRIDYFSLDVEGAELDVLKTIPFKEVYIDIIGIEFRVSFGSPETPFIDFENTRAKLGQLRAFFSETGIYKEVGILPKFGSTAKWIEENGLDVFFQRLK